MTSLDGYRLWLLVRRDLPRSVQAVQAAHAAIELMHRGGTDIEHEWGQYGPTISMLAMTDERELMRWAMTLGEGAALFCEPDLSNSPTALAYYGPEQPGFHDLRLL